MFSNLSKGSILYGLDTKGGVKMFTATVDSVSMPRPKYVQNTLSSSFNYILEKLGSYISNGAINVISVSVDYISKFFVADWCSVK